jgi:hypothetical protein
MRCNEAVNMARNRLTQTRCRSFVMGLSRLKDIQKDVCVEHNFHRCFLIMPSTYSLLTSISEGKIPVKRFTTGCSPAPSVSSSNRTCTLAPSARCAGSSSTIFPFSTWPLYVMMLRCSQGRSSCPVSEEPAHAMSFPGGAPLHPTGATLSQLASFVEFTRSTRKTSLLVDPIAKLGSLEEQGSCGGG